MGGRKEDTAKMKEKRRPLSIIEEFENKDDILSVPDTRKFSVPKIVITSENGELTSDLAQLKKTATRLNLSTRRESYIAWRAEHIDKQHNVPKPVLKVDHDERLTAERKKKIDDALEWLRNELVSISTTFSTHTCIYASNVFHPIMGLTERFYI